MDMDELDNNEVCLKNCSGHQRLVSNPLNFPEHFFCSPNREQLVFLVRSELRVDHPISPIKESADRLENLKKPKFWEHIEL